MPGTTAENHHYFRLLLQKSKATISRGISTFESLQGTKVVVPNFRGHGDSKPPKEKTIRKDKIAFLSLPISAWHIGLMLLRASR